MTTLELEPGVYRLPTVREPTLIIPAGYPVENRWRVLLTGLENQDAGGNAINAYAPIRIIGCQITHGTTDFGVDVLDGVGNGISAHAECTELELQDCWIHHNSGNGILTRAETRLHAYRCLIERNGTHCQFDHNLYINGEYELTNCLILNATKTPIQAHKPTAKGTLYRCVIYGSERNRTILGSYPGACKIHRSTIFGDAPLERTAADDGWQPMKKHRSNLYYPDCQDGVDDWFLTYPQYHLFMPSGPLEKPEVGAYDYYEQLHTTEQAEALWRSGCADGWGEGSYKSQHTYPFPIFPGDPYPEVA